MFNYDPATDVGKVRMLIPDRDSGAVSFQDEEIEAILFMEPNVLRATALALETVASDLAISLRITTVLGLSVNGATASDAIIRRSNMLRKQADDIEARTGGSFDWAEMVFDEFTMWERLNSELLRSS